MGIVFCWERRQRQMLRFLVSQLPQNYAWTTGLWLVRFPHPQGKSSSLLRPIYNPPGQPGGQPLGEAADKCIMVRRELYRNHEVFISVFKRPLWHVLLRSARLILSDSLSFGEWLYIQSTSDFKNMFCLKLPFVLLTQYNLHSRCQQTKIVRTGICKIDFYPYSAGD